MAILIKHDGTIEPFNLKLLRQTRWSLMAPTRGRTEEADEYDGEVDFGAEFQSQDIELHCITNDGLSIEEKHQKKVEIADILNNFREGNWLLVEIAPRDLYTVKIARYGQVYYGEAYYYTLLGRKILAHFTGRVQIEEYPTWLKVVIPLRLDPFWVGMKENRFRGSSGTLENKGIFETPVIIEVLADSGSVENPSITIGEEEVKYNGIISQGETLTINTDKMTVILDNENALANYEGGFPKLPPGNTDISVTADSGNPTVTFKWHDRWV